MFMKFILSVSKVILFFLVILTTKITFSQSACISGRIYDEMQSGFHSTIATLPDGSFSAWGELIPASGTGNQLIPVSLTPVNGYTYTGVPLFASLGSNSASNMQAFLMSSTGLYAWGKEGIVVPNAVTSSAAFQQINMPIGVTPSQIKAMLATNNALTLHTITGEIWVCGIIAEMHGAGATLPTAGTNYWTRVTTSAVGNPILTDVLDYRISPRGGIAYTNSGTWYTWGSMCYTGNGVAAAALQNRATPMTAPFVGVPKMLAITSDLTEPSYFALNSANNKMYALGNNSTGQLGQNNIISQKGWVIVKNALGTGDLLNVVFISANDQDGRGTEGAAGCITSDDHLYLWGSNSGTGMIGAPSTSLTVLLPRHPDGYAFGVDFPLYVEVGGHTTGYLRECADRYCYVGHKTNGSMGDNVSVASFINLFDCANTPQALICNASSYDSGDAPLSFESTAPAAHYYRCPAGIQLGVLTPNSNNLSPANVLAGADNMTTNGDGLEEDGMSSLATYTGSSSYSFTFTAQNTTTITGNIYGWVDWNGNGVFELSEYKTATIAAGVASQTYTFTYSGLSGVFCGKKYLRLRATNDVMLDNVATTNIDERSIGIANSGEIEDYYVNATISISAGTDQSISCLPLSTITATMSAIGTGTWTASSTNPGTSVIGSLTATNSSISSFSADGIYKYIWTSGTCKDTVAITIAGGITPTLTTSSSATVLCSGNSGTLTASGLSTYTWSPGSFVGNSYLINPTVATIYTVTGTSTIGCTATKTINISINANPSLTLTSASSICYGLSTSLAASGATSYSWNTGSTSPSIVVSPTTTTNYTVVGTNALGCASTQTLNLTVNTLPSISASSTSTAVCVGSSATLTASGGTSYSWNTGATTAAISVAPTVLTTYTVTGTNALGCSNTQTLNLTVNSLPSITASSTSTAICPGASATLTASGGTSYSWNTGATTTAITVNPLTTTIYTVTGTNALSCSNTQTISLTLNSLPSIIASASSASLCSGATATLTGSGASTYTWNPGASTGAIFNVTPGSTTIYTVTGTSVAGCSNTQTLNLTVNTTPTVTAVSASSAICSGSTTTLTGSGASTYIWNPGALAGTSVSVNPTSTTIYTLTGSISGCTNSQTVSLTVNTTPTVNAVSSSSAICSGATATLTGSGASSYTWNPGAIASSVITVNPLTTTIYTLTGVGSSGCINTKTLSLTINTIPTVNASSSSTAVCSGATATLTGSGASTYTWNPGGISGTAITVNPISTSIYTLTGTSIAGCINSQTISLTANSIPILTLTASSSTVCLNAATTLSASGATSYTWNPGALTGSSITRTVTAAVVYTVNCLSVEGCSSLATISISLNNCPTAVNDATNTIENTPVIANAGTNDAGTIGGTFTVGPPSVGTGTITMNPATGQYTFTPSLGYTGITTASYTLCNGSPVVCSSAVITITVFPALIANPDVIATTPSVTTTGSLTINDIGVVAGANYSVSVTQPAPSTGTITINPTTGQYTFTPNPSFTGSVTTTYTICNTSVSPTVCSTTTITILVGNLPVAVADFNTTMINTAVTGNASTNDSGASPSLFPIYTVGPLTIGTGTLTMNSSTGQYTYTPTPGFTGTTIATYTLCNLSSPPCSTTTITFTVYPTLVAVPDIILTTPSVTATGTLTINDLGVVPGATYSVSITQPAPSTGTITLNPTTGQYTFTPNPTFTGSVSTTYTICNTSVSPSVCSTTTITIIVGNLPLALPDVNTTMENTAVTGNASINDSGAAPSLVPVYTAGPVTIGTGTLTMDPATGNYTYTPALGFTGTTTATYTLCNISSPPCSTTTITFTVYPTLVAVPDVITTTPSVTVTGGLTINDLGVVPGATYSVSVTQPAPSTGTIIIDPATGNYTFTPNPTFTGSVTTTYTICNTSVTPSVCSTTTITIVVGNQQIAAAKALISVQKINPTTFQSVYSFNVSNVGTFIATNVQLVDNLNSTFPAPITYTVVGLNAAAPLTINSAYDGNTNIGLLSGSDNLGVAQSAIVTLTVNFNPNTTTLTAISNSGIASTSSAPDPLGSGTHLSSDTTQTGTVPDPNGDGNPNGPGENNPTLMGQQIAAAKSASILTKLSATSYQTVFTFNVNNVGPVVATNVQLVDNLNTTFPAPITYTVVGLNAGAPLTANASYDGNTVTALLSGSDALNVSQNAIVTLTVNFSPNASTISSLSNYGIVSTSNLPDPTGGGTHTSVDTTDAGTNTDFDGDGNPNESGENDPTYFGQQIGAAKNAESTVKLANGDNQTTFLFTLQNLGVVPATNVQLQDDLNITFPSPITYTVSSLTSGGTLTTDLSYNGNSNINLLTGTNTLTVGEIATVKLVINFTMNNSTLTSLFNYGVAITLGSGGSFSADTTNTGTIPDTDGDGNPNEFGENIPTEFVPLNDVYEDPGFNIPQGFSPNGDGVNDLFVIRGISKYPNNKFTILNRWGSVVYKMDGYDNTWNGKSSEGIRFGGDDLPDGTYFYILDLGNDEKPYKGFIYINKTVK